MSIQKALVAQSSGPRISDRISTLLEDEIRKGCSRRLSRDPVGLEPPYQSIASIRDLSLLRDQPPWITLQQIPRLNPLTLWVPKTLAGDWKISERVLKQLKVLQHPMAFEIYANSDHIHLGFKVHPLDALRVEGAFIGVYPLCQLTPRGEESFHREICATRCLAIEEYYPVEAYHNLLTSPEELQQSPLEMFLNVAVTIEPPTFAFYQLLFQAVPINHNWHKNIEVLQDVEFTQKVLTGLHPPQRMLNQLPSADLHNMASDLTVKAHNDKPFFACIPRVSIFGTDDAAGDDIKAISSFMHMFQHGGRPLARLDLNDFAAVLRQSQIQEMLQDGTSHRPGFIVNSHELSGLVHIPPLDSAIRSEASLTVLELLSPRVNASETSDTVIGQIEYAGTHRQVVIPSQLRERHTWLTGGTGMGKSTMLGNMILSDIRKGHGITLIDPHGELVDQVLSSLEEVHTPKVIYANPNLQGYVLRWNPFRRLPHQIAARVVDNLMESLMSFVEKRAWGDRTEHILRMTIYSLLLIGEGSAATISLLLRKKKKGKCKLAIFQENLIRKILESTNNLSIRQFWEHDFQRYTDEHLSPSRHKLSKIMLFESIACMLSQRESLLDLRQVIDDGTILLVDLSSLSSMTRRVLGCFMLSLLHSAAISRHEIPHAQRMPYHIYADEAHLFVTDTLEDMIVQNRKYRVSLTLANHYLTQFDQAKIDALSTVGSSILFNVNSRDAKVLSSQLRGEARYDDIIALEPYQAIARIGTDIVRFRALPPPSNANPTQRDKILQNSLKSYYRPIQEVLAETICEGTSEPRCLINLGDALQETREDYQYAEF